MKFWAALSQAATGWVMILRGQPGWRTCFSLTAPGLVTALVIFAFMAFLIVVFVSMSMGMPTAIGIVAAMAALALPILALAASLMGTRIMLKSTVPMLPVMVPGTYGLVAFVVAEGLLAMIGGPLVVASWLALAYGLYRLSRAATGWTGGVAAGFAVLTVAMLVAMRIALYMLNSTPGSPI